MNTTTSKNGTMAAEAIGIWLDALEGREPEVADIDMMARLVGRDTGFRDACLVSALGDPMKKDELIDIAMARKTPKGGTGTVMSEPFRSTAGPDRARTARACSMFMRMEYEARQVSDGRAVAACLAGIAFIHWFGGFEERALKRACRALEIMPDDSLAGIACAALLSGVKPPRARPPRSTPTTVAIWTVWGTWVKCARLPTNCNQALLVSWNGRMGFCTRRLTPTGIEEDHNLRPKHWLTCTLRMCVNQRPTPTATS